MKQFFSLLRKWLKDDGLVLIQEVGINSTLVPNTDMFLQKTLFMNAYFPSATDITEATKGLFMIEDWHNFGYDIFRTFESLSGTLAREAGGLFEKGKLNTETYRLLQFFYQFAAGVAKARRIHDWQIILSKHGAVGGYVSER